MANQYSGIWDKAKIEKAKAILKTHFHVADACPEISKALGAQVTIHSIRSAFRRNNTGAPSSFLKVKPIVELPPVERREKEEQVAYEKRHFNDVVSELREARKRQAFLDEVKKYKAPPIITAREKQSGPREMTAVVGASDWHVEEEVDPESIAYRNSYSLKIAEARIHRFFNGVIWNVKHQRASGLIFIRDLVLWLGGDLITGYIHEELMETNALSPTETVLWLIPHLRHGIKRLLKELSLDGIVIPCSYGNHGRTTPKRRIHSGAANSYEWMMYKVLADHFKDDKRVRFEITASAHQYVRVYDYTLHFHHGDEVMYGGGVGGLSIPLLKAVGPWELLQPADIHHVGHFHQLLNFSRVIVNGSLIGYNAYAQSIRASYEAPQQFLYYLDSKRGKTMFTPLWVGEREPSRLIKAA